MNLKRKPLSIIIKNLSHIYNPKAPFKKVALDDVSLNIEEGDFFGIIGHTGSGKSTLISHLNGLIKLQSGSLIVDGIDLSKKYDYKELRAKVGMVFQYPERQLFDTTVERDIGFGPRNMKLEQGEIDKRVKEAMHMVGLDVDKIKDRSPFEISGGQMRRVALAGVLAMKPKILILDEPTAGLDPKGKKQILDLVNSLRGQVPTIVMISHNMDEIFENCNKIAVLSEGRLKGVFSPRELYNNSDIVTESGLKMPSVYQIIKALKDKGFKDLNAISEEELVEALMKNEK